MFINSPHGFLKIVADQIRYTLNKELRLAGDISLFLTGGRTASQLYRFMAANNFEFSKSVKIYFGDERCVPEDDQLSNLGMLRRHWTSITSDGAQIFGIHGDAPSPEIEANRYSGLMPTRVSLVLLSVGEDGHIASLFPYDAALFEQEREVLSVRRRDQNLTRITITPLLLRRARNIVLMAAGRQKGKLLAEAIASGSNITRYPVCLTLGGTWVLDREAAKAFLDHHRGGLKDGTTLFAAN